MRSRGTGRARRRLARAASVLGVFGLCVAALAHAAEDPVDAGSGAAVVDYLMIRGNEGGSAGGHTAIRFGDATFHFEHADGLLRLSREDSEHFQYVYRTIQNRDIALSRVPVSSATFARLEATFERRTLVQARQLAIEEEIRGDRELLTALRDVQRGARSDAASVEVRGAGFFEPAAAPTQLADAGVAGIAALRARVETLHGPDFLGQRRAALEQALATLTPQVIDVDAIELDSDRYPVLAPSFSRRTESWLAARLALELLARPRALRTQALLPAGEAPALGSGERERLGAAAVALRESMARLVASPREDWGFALLLGMARLAAIEVSLQSDRWVVLDRFPSASATLAVSATQRELLPELLSEARADFEAARRTFVESPRFREREWNALEMAAARWHELRGAAAGAPEIRLHPGVMIPEARANLAAPLRPGGDLTPLVERSQAAAIRYRERLLALSGYDLIRHNCVSEIFRTLDAALAGEGAPDAPDALRAFVRDESTRRLGGYVDPIGGFNFIPFVSSQRVRERYRVVEEVLLPSYRHFRLAEMAASESPLWVALRESNVLTARTHQAAGPEGFFVFYTDTQVPLRPLFGAVNVGAGLLRSVVGLVALPLDGGRGLRSGLTSVLFSLPELAFQNIRKGYNDYVPPAERPPPG